MKSLLAGTSRASIMLKKLLKNKKSGKTRSFLPVPPEGLEPPTYCSASKRSNPLSYEGVSERTFYSIHPCWSRCDCNENQRPAPQNSFPSLRVCLPGKSVTLNTPQKKHFCYTLKTLASYESMLFAGSPAGQARVSRYNRGAMSDKRPEDLSVEELRRLLLDKRRVNRRDRLEGFRRTGRVVSLAPDPEIDPGNELGAERVVDTPEEETAPDARSTRSTRRRWTDNLLLGVEILALIVLVGVVLNGLSILRTLNQEAAAAIQQPTMAPTALITAVVLPSGHTPPNSAQGAQPNDAEIPEHLRPLVPSLENIALPTASPQQGIRIQIPAIHVDAPIVQGDGWEQLKKGVAQHLGTPNPGENGNVVFSAHNDIFGEIFRDLDKLQPGDVIILYTSSRQFTYLITGSQIVEPTRVEVMASTPNAVVTLISCHPYLIDNQRIVVSAVLQNP